MLFINSYSFSDIQIFEKCGKISSVTIALKKDPKRPNEVLSMGYGFVEYSKSSDADKAIKNLQVRAIYHCFALVANSILGGHLQISILHPL